MVNYILVAEDDADDRFLLQTAFDEKGYTDKIEFVENGVELLDYLNAVSKNDLNGISFPGFILMDLNMPKKDGKEALREIKQHPIFKKIPVVIYTTTKSEMGISKNSTASLLFRDGQGMRPYKKIVFRDILILSGKESLAFGNSFHRPGFFLAVEKVCTL